MDQVVDRIETEYKDYLIINHSEFENNYFELKGYSHAILNVIWRTTDTKIITDLFQCLIESFKARPTEMGDATFNLLFTFMTSFSDNKEHLKVLKFKMLYALLEENYEPAITDWFANGGKDSCFAKSEQEWVEVIGEVITNDHRSAEQIDNLLRQGHGTDYDRTAIRVKGILEGYTDGDNLTLIILRIMRIMKIVP